MKKKEPPKEQPMNKNPFIRCEGECKTITPHTFVRENRIYGNENSFLGYEQMFACDGCKTERRYGFSSQSCLPWSRSAA